MSVRVASRRPLILDVESRFFVSFSMKEFVAKFELIA